LLPVVDGAIGTDAEPPLLVENLLRHALCGGKLELTAGLVATLPNWGWRWLRLRDGRGLREYRSGRWCGLRLNRSGRGLWLRVDRGRVVRVHLVEVGRLRLRGLTTLDRLPRREAGLRLELRFRSDLRGVDALLLQSVTRHACAIGIEGTGTTEVLDGGLAGCLAWSALAGSALLREPFLHPSLDRFEDGAVAGTLRSVTLQGLAPVSEPLLERLLGTITPSSESTVSVLAEALALASA